MSDVLIEGELEKQGGSHKNWKRRFFRVGREGFSYFKSSKETSKPIRTFDLKTIYVSPNKEVPSRPHCFVVFTTQRDFNLVVDAASNEELGRWITAIRLSREKFAGVKEDWSDAGDEISVRNSLQITRDVIFLDSEKNKKMKDMLTEFVLRYADGWNGEIMKVLDTKRTQFLEFQKTFAEEICKLREQLAARNVQTLADVIAAEQSTRKQLMEQSKQHSKQLRELTNDLSNRLKEVRKQHNVMIEFAHEESSAMRRRYENEMSLLRDLIESRTDEVFAAKQENISLRTQASNEHQIVEELLFEKELECSSLVAQEKVRVDLEIAALQMERLRLEKIWMAKAQLMVSEKTAEYETLRAKEIEERDRLILQARFGHDLFYSDGEAVEFYTGRSLQVSTKMLEELSAQHSQLEKDFADYKEKTTKDVDDLKMAHLRREQASKDMVDAYKRQLDGSKEMFDSQLKLLKTAHKQEVASYVQEIKSLGAEIRKRDEEITVVRLKLGEKDRQIENLSKEYDNRLAQALADFEIQKASQVAELNETISILQEECVDKAHELSVFLSRKEAEVASARIEAEQRSHMRFEADLDDLEKEIATLRTQAQLGKMFASSELSNAKFDYSDGILSAEARLKRIVEAAELQAQDPSSRTRSVLDMSLPSPSSSSTPAAANGTGKNSSSDGAAVAVQKSNPGSTSGSPANSQPSSARSSFAQS